MNPLTFLVLNLLETVHDIIETTHDGLLSNARDNDRRMLK